MTKFRNFYYTITERKNQPQPNRGLADDVLLHIFAQPDAQHLYSNSYPDMPAAIVAAEQWIGVVHDTVLDYYRGYPI